MQFSQNRVMDKDNALILLDEVNKLWQQNQIEEALNLCHQIVHTDVMCVEAWNTLGEIFNQLGRVREAILVYEDALKYHPNVLAFWVNRGNALYRLGQFQEAVKSYDHALEIDAKDVDIWFYKGSVWYTCENYTAAVACYEAGLKLSLDDVRLLFHCGNALAKLLQFEDAIEKYDRALVLRPYDAQLWFNKGIALKELLRYSEALYSYDQAILCNPRFIEAIVAHGNVLTILKQYMPALEDYRTAIKLDSECLNALVGMVNVFHILGDRHAELESCIKVCEMDPDRDHVLGRLLYAKLKVWDWQGIETLLKLLEEKMKAGLPISSPFVGLIVGEDNQLQKDYTAAYVQNKFPVNNKLGNIQRTRRNGKIRVGYFSADFHNHATTYLMAELFESHDKECFEWIAFSFGPEVEDRMRLRLRNSFDQFIEVGNKTDEEVAQLSRTLGIDIAVDLKGFTGESRTGIFAYRAAPIQVNYLGYPGTMGASYMDYLIADKVVIPKNHQEYYTEKIAYLPYCYQPNDQKRIISERVYTRKEVGLPEEGFVFCCFNNNYKILPEVFSIWMRLLQKIPGSVLWMLEEDPIVIQNLRSEALKSGVDSARLIFGERMELSLHLARHRLVDLFLDTWPYNAHTTTSDALCMGVPVLTYCGATFASRVAASLLTNLGVSELIVNSNESYEEKAYMLATKPAQLVKLKQKIMENKEKTTLFKGALIAKHLEQIYKTMVTRWEAGLPPDEIENIK